MALHPFTSFSKANRRQIYLLCGCHLLWSGAVLLLWQAGQAIASNQDLWSGVFIVLQLFAAAQLLLPVLQLQPEERSRGFYIFWCLILVMCLWLLNQLPSHYREVIILHHLQGLTMLQVASEMGRSVDSVRKRWARALVKLRNVMRDER